MKGNTIRTGYRWLNGIQALAALPFRSGANPPVIWLGGARSGSGGGPLVKAKLLRDRFGDKRIGYGVLYLLSNALYLPDPVLRKLRAAQIPITLNQNGVFYPAWYPNGWERENDRMSSAYHLASHVFWQSEFCKTSADKFLGERTGPGEILYNAVDTDRFHPRKTQSGRPSRLLVTGKFCASTAYRLFSSVAGLAECRRGGHDVKLTIAGGIDEDVLRELHYQMEELGVRDQVEVLGPYANANAPDIYRNADVYLMLKHNDPCPNVVLEALASGLPILYSESGGVPELVGPDAGIGMSVEQSYEAISTPKPIAIAEAVTKILASYPEMSTAARTRAQNLFGLEGWLSRHEQVFTALIRDGKVQ